MCGVAGLFDRERRGRHRALETCVADMMAALHLRGPDDEGAWIDAEAGIGLGHRRLAVVDLTSAGHQPMVSLDGRYVLSYNGEIYNFRELADDLRGAGRPVHGDCDTSVLVEACSLWGVRGTLERLNGMFAFALWDRESRVLTLVRDRIGIKPLVWAQAGEIFAFASDLNALRRGCPWSWEVDPSAVSAFFKYAYVPAPATIFKNAFKLPPGHLLTIPPSGEPRLECYWDLHRISAEASAAPLDLSQVEAADHVEDLLRDAVGRQMVSDVPLGVFLSGGVDSSTVAALARSFSDRTLRTFSIGFTEKGYDESGHARLVAAHLGTDHTGLVVTASDALAVVPDLARHYDEPFADSSQIPTLLLSLLARRHVTVALSGDGGDELFAGYNRHLAVPALWRAIGWIPSAVRRGIAAGLERPGLEGWRRLVKLVPDRRRPPEAADKLFKLFGVLSADGPEGIYERLVSQWPEPHRIVRGAPEPARLFDVSSLADVTARLQLLDATTYLPDDILTKVDRASMAVSLEVRVPLLDHRLVEFAWRLPRRLLMENGRGKAVLRRVLDRHVPRGLIDRPKAGFAVPLADWLRGPLRDWAEDLLSEHALAADGLLDSAAVRRVWLEHLSGRHNRQHQLWVALMFQSWRRRIVAEGEAPALESVA